mgnify:CR=1 FL=1
MTTIQQLRNLRASMPQGKKDPWGKCCKSKRVLLGRALRKDTIADLTDGEKSAVEEWLAYISQARQEINLANQELERTIAQIVQL